jgi:predicted aspartyl protease
VLVPFDDTYDPPMPVLPVHVSGVDADGPGVLLHAVVDTGADCSVIPERSARVLRLPIVDMVSVEGFAGDGKPRPIYAARLRFGGHNILARVVAFGEEPLVGRDVLNRLVLHLDGPAQKLRVMQIRRKRAPKPKR